LTQDTRARLRKRSADLHRKYGLNGIESIRKIIEDYDKGNPIDESHCDYILNITEEDVPFIQQLLYYYPIKLKQLRRIGPAELAMFREVYGHTLILLAKHKGGSAKKQLGL